jgi:hypothetical protein
MLRSSRRPHFFSHELLEALRAKKVPVSSLTVRFDEARPDACITITVETGGKCTDTEEFVEVFPGEDEKPISPWEIQDVLRDMLQKGDLKTIFHQSVIEFRGRNRLGHVPEGI